MAGRRAHVSAGFGRLPGKVVGGSQAFYRKNAMSSARGSMGDIIKEYEKLVRALNGATPEFLLNAMQPVFDKSQEYVPKQTGALAASGKLTISGGLSSPSASISYGDATAWYAALVHEQVWANHAPPTRAKYLQAAMEEEMDSFLVSLAIDYGGFFR